MNRFKKIIWLIIGGIIILSGLIFVLEQKKTSTTPAIVGVITPLTGDAVSIGEFVRKAIELEGYKNFSIRFEDDACDPQKAVSAYNLLKAENIKIFYMACSGSVLSVAPLAKQNGDLIITAYAGSAEIRKSGDETIRFIPDAESVGLAMSNYVKSLPNTSKYALLYEDQAYSYSAANIIKPFIKENLVTEETYKADSSDVRTQLTKIKGTGATHIILIPVSEKPTYAIYKQMYEMGMRQKIIGDVNVCDYKIAPAEYKLDTTCWKAELPKEKADIFANKYAAKYDGASGAPFYDAATYDAMHILDQVVGTVGKIQVSAIKKVILQGVTGPISSYTFSDNGEVTNINDYLRMIER
jgi:ABC-type branched-subunit amino acid transport system substrate-binding protein